MSLKPAWSGDDFIYRRRQPPPQWISHERITLPLPLHARPAWCVDYFEDVLPYPMLLPLLGVHMSATMVPEVINVAYTTQTFPVGTGPIASITAILTGSAPGNTNSQTVSVPLGATSVTVSLLPDTYTWTLTNHDSGGNVVGAAATGTGVVAAPATITLSVASGLTFT